MHIEFLLSPEMEIPANEKVVVTIVVSGKRASTEEIGRMRVVDVAGYVLPGLSIGGGSVSSVRRPTVLMMSYS